MYPLAKSTFKVVFKWSANCFKRQWVTAWRSLDFQDSILGIQSQTILRDFQLWPKFLVSYKIYMYANSCTNSVIFTFVFRHCGCYDTHSLIWCSVFNEICVWLTGQSYLDHKISLSAIYSSKNSAPTFRYVHLLSASIEGEHMHTASPQCVRGEVRG